MPHTIRTFIAIQLPERIISAAEQIQNKLKTANADVKWVEPKNIHLTLKFLGNISVERLKAVEDMMIKCASNVARCSARLDGLGVFPSLERLDILWIGVHEKTGRLAAMVKMLEDQLAVVGFPKEDRAFTSHITLGRARSANSTKELTEKLKTVEILDGDFEINELTLLQSFLSSSGPTYVPLFKAPLKI